MPPPTEAEKGAALEALAALRQLSRQEAYALTAVGLTPGDRRCVARPWDEADVLVARRLADVRGWSTVAIATYLHRPEIQVREMLEVGVAAPAGVRIHHAPGDGITYRPGAGAPETAP